MARKRIIKTKKALKACLKNAGGKRERGKCLGAYARGHRKGKRRRK